MLAWGFLFALDANAGAPSAVAQYGDALSSYRKGRGRLEHVFDLAVAAGQELEKEIIHRDEANAGGKAVAPMGKPPDGLLVSVDEALYAIPDPAFFAALALKSGSETDKAFFGLLAQTRVGAWAVYIEQRTDVTGCARFELPLTASLYGDWLAFEQKHPDAYSSHVREQLHGFEDLFLNNTCACGTQRDVLEGLERVLKVAPKGDVARGVKKRIDQIRDGTTAIRFHCKT